MIMIMTMMPIITERDRLLVVCISLPYRCPFSLWLPLNLLRLLILTFLLLPGILRAGCMAWRLRSFSALIGTPLTGGNKRVGVHLPNLVYFTIFLNGCIHVCGLVVW